MVPWLQNSASSCGLTLAATLFATDQVNAQDPVPSPVTSHHRVLWMVNPQSEAILSWSTDRESRKNRVYVSRISQAAAEELTEALMVPSFKSGMFTMTPDDRRWSPPAFYHHSHVTGLEPDTRYFVTFASDDARSREFHFKTAPADDQEFAIVFGGDSRIGGDQPYEHTDRQKMNDRIAALFEANPEIIAFAHGGDYCQLAQWRYLAPWLTDHERTTTSDGRLLPIIPARGNHDMDIGFEEMFPRPNVPTNYYYMTTLSPEVSLVTLNTEISVAGDQQVWASSTLRDARQGSRYVVVQYHRPAYSSVRSMQDGAPRRDHWVPLFERFNVDLVLESHDHALKRTLPIRNGQPDMTAGITYIGDGGLGVPQRDPDPNRWWLQEPGFARSVHHVHTLHFGPEELRVRAHGMDGRILDEFVLEPRTTAAVVAY